MNGENWVLLYNFLESKLTGMSYNPLKKASKMGFVYFYAAVNYWSNSFYIHIYSESTLPRPILILRDLIKGWSNQLLPVLSPKI